MVSLEDLLTQACEKLESLIGWHPSPFLGPETDDPHDTSKDWPLELHDWWEPRRPCAAERARRLLAAQGFTEAEIAEAIRAPAG